jgi:hypothetical protein
MIHAVFITDCKNNLTSHYVVNTDYVFVSSGSILFFIKANKPVLAPHIEGAPSDTTLIF